MFWSLGHFLVKYYLILCINWTIYINDKINFELQDFPLLIYLFFVAWDLSTNNASDLSLLRLNVDKLCGSIHKTANLQSKLPIKIQWGSVTRPWRGLSDRFRTLVACFDSLGSVLINHSSKRYFDALNRYDCVVVSEFFQIFADFFDQLEQTKKPSSHFVIRLSYTIILLNLRFSLYITELKQLFREIMKLYCMNIAPIFCDFLKKNSPNVSTWIIRWRPSCIQILKNLSLLTANPLERQNIKLLQITLNAYCRVWIHVMFLRKKLNLMVNHYFYLNL